MGNARSMEAAITLCLPSPGCEALPGRSGSVLFMLPPQPSAPGVVLTMLGHNTLGCSHGVLPKGLLLWELEPSVQVCVHLNSSL